MQNSWMQLVCYIRWGHPVCYVGRIPGDIRCVTYEEQLETPCVLRCEIAGDTMCVTYAE